MSRTIKEKIKKLAAPVICGTVVLASVGATALAAEVGSITGSMTNNTAKVTLCNTSSSTRYCCVAINEYDNKNEVHLSVNSSSGRLSSGVSHTITGTIKKNHAVGQGSVYRGGSLQSGIEKGYEIELK